MDFFREEYAQFQWDVHILIEGTLRAAITYLDSEVKTDLSKIEKIMENAHGDYHEYLVDEHVDVLAQNSEQEVFLRNIALVALASRLTHSLRTMARSAEIFSPRKKQYGKPNMSEFARLWLEYEERFGIDFNANASRIAFLEPLREVRNQIVHDGGEANTYRSLMDINLDDVVGGLYNTKFSEAYPEYVQGNDVSVSPELLQKNITSAIALIGWLATELRKRQLAMAGEAPKA
jgi:hypothetical protein